MSIMYNRKVLICTLLLAICGASPAKAQPQAELTVTRARELADRDKPNEALAILKRIITTQPSFVSAHAALVRIKIFYLNRYDDVRAEYDRLMSEHPDDVTFSIAFILGAAGALPSSTQTEWYQRIAEKSPDSYWGHYAKAQLIFRSDPEAAVRELRAAIAQDPNSPEAYESLLFVLERALKDSARALRLAEEMSTKPNLAARTQAALWRLRLANAGGSQPAKEELRRELASASQSTNVTVLAAILQTYAVVLNDSAAADQIAGRMRQIDPSWYPVRGVATIVGLSSPGGVDRLDTLAGRALSHFGKVRQTDDISDPAARVAALEALLKTSPTDVVTRFIRERMFVAAEAAGNVKVLVPTAQALLRFDPADAAVPARLALQLGAKSEGVRQALRHADAAAQLTKEWRPIKRPTNTDARWFSERVPETKQRDIFRRQRALALEARGYCLCKSRNCRDAEPLLRESVSLDRSERNLAHLAEALEALNRRADAEQARKDAAIEFAAGVRKKMISEPAKEFRLRTIGDETMSLSDLKGRVIVLNFWATWCGPCRSEMPQLLDLYRRSKARGLDVLGVTTDAPSDRPRIADFAQQLGVTYPILYAEGLDEKYGVNGLPTTFVIDRAGRIRYRLSGFQGETTTRELEAVVEELLK